MSVTTAPFPSTLRLHQRIHPSTRLPMGLDMANRSVNDQRWRTTLPVVGFACIFLGFASVGCKSGSPPFNGFRQNSAANNSLFSFFGQTRVAPPATGSYLHSSTLQDPNKTAERLGEQDERQGTDTNQSPIRQLPAPRPNAPNTGANQQSDDEVWPESFGPRSSTTPATRSELTTPLSFRQGLPATDLTQVSGTTNGPNRPNEGASPDHSQTQVIASQWASTLPVHANYTESLTDEPKNVTVSESQPSPINASPSVTTSTLPQTTPQPIKELDWRKPNTLP